MIIYRKGDATLPKEKGKVMIGHVCNDCGVWGAGFVVPLGNRYPSTKELYLAWANRGFFYNRQRKVPFRLGEYQLVIGNIGINDCLFVANIVAQSGLQRSDWLIPFRYQSFAEALIKLNKYLVKNKFDYFVAPRLGCGISGGDWHKVSLILDKCISIPIVIYDINPEEWPGTIYKS